MSSSPTTKVLSRRDPGPGAGLRKALAAVEAGPQASPSPILNPPETPEEIKATCDAILFDSFTAHDAWELGHLLYARLLPFAAQGQPTLVSIALANSGQVLFQTAVGVGTSPDNEVWVRRKRNTVLRFGASSWLMHCKFAGDDEGFRIRFGMSPAQASEYAIHGGGVPIKVKGVEGVVAVVVVSGLKQEEDHGVIFDVVRENYH